MSGAGQCGAAGAPVPAPAHASAPGAAAAVAVAVAVATHAAVPGTHTVSGFSLRELVPADYDRVFALWSVTEGMGLNESDTGEAIAAFLARNAGLSRVAEDAATGELLGALLCGHDGRRGYLHHLAVAHSRRRRGIGRALVDACLEGLRGQGIPKCNLFLYADNEAGRSFWEHAGWRARVDLVMMQVNVDGAASSQDGAGNSCASCGGRSC